MSKNKKSFTKHKLALALALALGCGVMNVASAGTTYDMNSSEYAGGIDVVNQPFGTYKDYDNFVYTYDAATNTVSGGALNISMATKYNNYIYGNFVIKKSDLPDMKIATLDKVYAELRKKLNYDSDSTLSNRRQNYCRFVIVDDDGTVLRQLSFAPLVENKYRVSSTVGTWKEVLRSDATGKEYYPISSVADPDENLPENNWNISGCTITIAPDFAGEKIKAAVQGADDNLTVGYKYGLGAMNITANGSADDTLYGIYNDQKGYINISNTGKLNITAAGNENSNAIYAGNNADYKSSVSAAIGSNGGAFVAGGDVLVAGKNGAITLTPQKVTLTSNSNGNIFHAYDGGTIDVYYKYTIDQFGYSDPGEGKYLALAENGGKINFGVQIKHLDDVDYDDVTYAQFKNNFTGDLKADTDSEINFGMKANGTSSSTYTGNVEGNVNLYMKDGMTWKGAALDGDTSLYLVNASNWERTSTAAEHLKKLSGGEAYSQRSFVNMTEGDLTIDKYTGSTVFAYDHDVSDPTKIIGGNLTITSAEPYKLVSQGIGTGSETSNTVSESTSNVYLRTSVDGIDTTNVTQVNDVLDSLAKKITYTAYANGERNLSGRVELAEGLTSSSITKLYQSLSFDEATGQGKTTGEIENPYTAMIMGNPTSSSEQNAYGDVISGTVADKDLKYTFDNDTLIEVSLSKSPRSASNLYNAAISNWGDQAYQTAAKFSANGPSYTIDMQGHDLNVVYSAFPAAGSTGSQPMWTSCAIGAFREGTITIDNPGKIYLESRNNYYYGSIIRASTGAATSGAHVVINNDNSKEHAVVMRGGIDTPSYELNWRALEAVTFYGDNKENANTIDIKGLVDIETKYAAAIFSRQGYSTISVGGGKIYAGKHESIWTAGNNTMVNVNMLRDEDGNVIGAGNNYVQITGDVRTSTDFYGEGGTINIGLTTPESFLDGHFYYSANPKENTTYNNNLWLSNGATWNNKGMVFHPWTGPEYTTSHESVLNNLYGGATADAAGNISQQEAKNITIKNMTGYVNAYLGHDIADDGSVSFDSLGNIVVEKATKTDGQNASMTLYTNRDGIDTGDKDKVVNTLSALGQKLIYNEAVATEDNPNPEINLDGRVGIAEGLTAGSVAIRLADLSFNSEDGKGELVESTIHTPDAYIPVIYGSSETAMMKGAKSAMASSALMWRAENNDLMKRMGDLRLDDGEAGIWAKYYGGKYEMDSQNTNLNLKYNAYQVGFDKEVGNNWKVGVAVSYNDGDSSYGTGKADLTGTSVGLYGTWNGNDGQYVDLIAKYTRIENEYDVMNDSGHKLKGDYKTWGTSISAEYGKRFESKSGFYFDPSVELTLGRINGKDYNAHSDYLSSVGVKKDMEVQQDAFNTFVGRLGFRVGQKLDNASYFAKLAVAHEFSGDFDTTFRAPGEPEGKTSIDFGDTWYEAQIGGSAKLSDNSMIYASFERSFGGDVDEKWRVDAGLRFSF